MSDFRVCGRCGNDALHDGVVCLFCFPARWSTGAHVRQCEECGVEFVSETVSKKFCDVPCRKRHWEKHTPAGHAFSKRQAERQQARTVEFRAAGLTAHGKPRVRDAA